MKVYVLYDNPYDEGWNVYGVFSIQEKVEKALESFAPESKNELHWESFELDELEKFFGVHKPKAYSGYASVYRPLTLETIKYIQWQSIYKSGLESFLVDGVGKNHMFLSNSLSFRVFADSEEEAIQKANEMLKELIKQPEDERGWKWLEK